MLWQVERKDSEMWVVFMVEMVLNLLSFMVLCVLSLGCIAVIVLILIALSVFVPTMIRTIKEELKRGNKDENG